MKPFSPSYHSPSSVGVLEFPQYPFQRNNSPDRSSPIFRCRTIPRYLRTTKDKKKDGERWKTKYGITKWRTTLYPFTWIDIYIEFWTCFCQISVIPVRPFIPLTQPPTGGIVKFKNRRPEFSSKRLKHIPVSNPTEKWKSILRLMLPEWLSGMHVTHSGV